MIFSNLGIVFGSPWDDTRTDSQDISLIIIIGYYCLTVVIGGAGAGEGRTGP